LKVKSIFRLFGIIILIIIIFPIIVLAGKTPGAGVPLPDLGLKAPLAEEDKLYLGIGKDETFSIKDIDAQLVLFEILGVYCPQCHIQHPLFNKLYFRIKKDPDLLKKIKFLGLAAGANPMEADYVKKENRIPFPIITDPKYEIHKLLGEPRTPFTMIIRKDGTIAFTHLGIINDMDDLLQKIKKMLP